MQSAWIAFAIAFFFAANIGASGTAASMGSAYGSGAVGSRRLAVAAVAIFAFAGAVIGGGEVAQTISNGIIPADNITVNTTIIILMSACLTLFISNRLGIPLSTSEVTVGSIVGVGLAVGRLYWLKLLFIVFAWLVLPIAAFGAAFALGRLLKPFEEKWVKRFPHATTKILRFLLVGAGCYEAYAAGMNNVANAVGPLIGSQIIGLEQGLWAGALCMAAGAILMGGRVLETTGKKITRMSLLQGSIVSATGGTLVILASSFGLPVPLTQATTMAIIGIGTEKAGPELLQSPTVKKIMTVWVVSPVASLLLSFSLYQAVMLGSLFSLTALIVMAIFVLVFLYQKSKRPALTGKDKRLRRPRSGRARLP